MTAGRDTDGAASPFTPTREDSVARLRAETAPLLATRVRGGLGLVLISIALFGTAQLHLNRPEIGPVGAVKLVQIATVIGVFLFLRRPRSWNVTVGVALFTVAEVCITAALSGILTREVMSTALVFVVLTMGSGALLPWGAGPQVATVAIAALSTIWNAALVPIDAEAVGYPAVALVLSFVSSVYVAYELDRYRQRRHVAEENLRASETRWKDEVQVTSALARIGREMISAVDTPLLLDGLCQRAAEALHTECAHAFLWSAGDDVFTPTAIFGDAPDRWEQSRLVRIPQADLALVLRYLHREELLLLGEDAPPDLHLQRLKDALGLVGGVVVGLKRGKEIAGLLVAGQRTTALVLTPQQLRIARGIGQLGSLALTNTLLVEELARSSRAKTEFVSVMSHELRTPLNLILGFADMAADDDFASDDRRELLDRIRASGADLLDLLESTLELGRIEAGRDDIKLESLALAPYWSDLGATCRRLPRQDGVTLDWREPAPAVSIVTDARKLSVVVRNLVHNALKFTERGFVRAQLSVEEDAVVVEVADTGVGIAPEDQETIFEAFRQSADGVGRRAGGTGLGLYIVRRFVQQLGGTVRLQSARGEGTTFTIRLPRRSAARRAA
jgi:signal transduction histidine kinase